ncbi:MAG: MFS transporter, partial [Candidatus Saccharibacteria bacterium]|nr:MFS transporter [Pseudorhodobacter sp.]
VMITGAGVMVAGVALTPLVTGLPGLLVLWAIVGFGFSVSQTPIGRILNRSAQGQDRPADFAAQFALSHAAWLVTYPLAGWLGASFGLPVAPYGLAMIGAVAMIAVLWLWPCLDPTVLAHDHPDLPPDHPHLQGLDHRHVFVIDGLHRRWPTGHA